MHFPGIESFDFYINFSKAKVTNLAILSYVLRNNMGNDIFLKKYFFTVIVKNGSCTLFGQTSHCGGETAEFFDCERCLSSRGPVLRKQS